MLPGKRVVKYDGRLTHRVEIAGLVRELPVVFIGKVEINGLNYNAWIASDADLVLGDVEFIGAVARDLAELLRGYDFDMIVTPESKSIALTYALARELGLPSFIVARKDVKSYMRDYLTVKVNSITTGREQVLVIDGGARGRVSGRRVCLFDDVVSTGSTMKALETLIKMVGADVVCRASIWLEGPWVSDDYVIHLGELPIFVDS
ncbi:phosphoribosyltransferase family protein [Vulcanisaeta thermophila]|uniref:phosphoribosyltransferase family protein n=1 Tax=Vulcanisaeta thermophila TaxID=867917 RepID=UPI000853C98F|nr:phosphoribosyltransferase family protein [Vulcanisaeta thermophila]